MSDRARSPLKLVDTNAVPARDPRALLERVVAPEVLHWLDQYLMERVAEIVEERLADLEFAGGKAWLTPVEAGRLLDCTPHAVRLRFKRGRLEGRYQGRRLYISARSLQELR